MARTKHASIPGKPSRPPASRGDPSGYFRGRETDPNVATPSPSKASSGEKNETDRLNMSNKFGLEPQDPVDRVRSRDPIMNPTDASDMTLWYRPIRVDEPCIGIGESVPSLDMMSGEMYSSRDAWKAALYDALELPKIIDILAMARDSHDICMKRAEEGNPEVNKPLLEPDRDDCDLFCEPGTGCPNCVFAEGAKFFRPNPWGEDKNYDKFPSFLAQSPCPLDINVRWESIPWFRSTNKTVRALADGGRVPRRDGAGYEEQEAMLNSVGYELVPRTGTSIYGSAGLDPPTDLTHRIIPVSNERRRRAPEMYGPNQADGMGPIPHAFLIPLTVFRYGDKSRFSLDPNKNDLPLALHHGDKVLVEVSPWSVDNEVPHHVYGGGGGGSKTKSAKSSTKSSSGGGGSSGKKSSRQEAFGPQERGGDGGGDGGDDPDGGDDDGDDSSSHGGRRRIPFPLVPNAPGQPRTTVFDVVDDAFVFRNTQQELRLMFQRIRCTEMVANMLVHMQGLDETQLLLPMTDGEVDTACKEISRGSQVYEGAHIPLTHRRNIKMMIEFLRQQKLTSREVDVNLVTMDSIRQAAINKRMMEAEQDNQVGKLIIGTPARLNADWFEWTEKTEAAALAYRFEQGPSVQSLIRDKLEVPPSAADPSSNYATFLEEVDARRPILVPGTTGDPATLERTGPWAADFKSQARFLYEKIREKLEPHSVWPLMAGLKQEKNGRKVWRKLVDTQLGEGHVQVLAERLELEVRSLAYYGDKRVSWLAFLGKFTELTVRLERLEKHGYKAWDEGAKIREFMKLLKGTEWKQTIVTQLSSQHELSTDFKRLTAFIHRYLQRMNLLEEGSGRSRVAAYESQPRDERGGGGVAGGGGGGGSSKVYNGTNENAAREARAAGIRLDINYPEDEYNAFSPAIKHYLWLNKDKRGGNRGRTKPSGREKKKQKTSHQKELQAHAAILARLESKVDKMSASNAGGDDAKSSSDGEDGGPQNVRQYPGDKHKRKGGKGKSS